MWIPIDPQVTVDFRAESKFSVLTWPDGLAEIEVATADLRAAGGGRYEVRVGAGVEVLRAVESSAPIPDETPTIIPDRPVAASAAQAGRTRCTGVSPFGWGLSVCKDTGVILGECHGCWG